MLSKKLLQSQPQTRPKLSQSSLSSLQGPLKQDKLKTRVEEVKTNSKVTTSPKIKTANNDINSANTSKASLRPSSALKIKPVIQIKTATRLKEIRPTPQVSTTHKSIVQKEKKVMSTSNKVALIPSSKPKSSFHNKLEDQKKVVPAEPVKRIELEPCIRQVSLRGEPPGRVRRFDDAQELYGFAGSLLDCRIISFGIHYCLCGFGLMADDIQITYKNVVTGQTFQTKERKDGLLPFGYPTITLEKGEFIEYAETAFGQYLKVRTDKGKETFVGNCDESTPSVFSIGDNVVIGAYSSGSGISGLGFYVAPRSELKYWRRPYILMKAWLAKNKDICDQLEQDRQEGKMKQLSLAAQAFFIVTTLMDKQIYRYILKYI